MPKKFYFFSCFIILVFGVFIYKVSDLAFRKHDFFNNKYLAINNVMVEGSTAPRGRILDINGKVLVDNIGVKTIFYHKKNGISLKEEIEIAKSLSKITDYSYEYSLEKLKDYYLLIRDTSNLITEEEKKLYSERKITKEELTNLKKMRITDADLESLSEEEKYSSYFYYLMNEGYVYDNKILLREVDEEVYAKIIEANLPGVFGEMMWERVYPYGDTLRSVLGEISNSLPKEKNYLIEQGYSLNDKVGISGLEEYYEEYLRGDKALYKLVNNNLVLVDKPKKGNDLVLEIDIDIQLKVEELIKEELIKAESMANTKYYKESYALISEPLTGKIKAIAGVRKLSNGRDISFQDVSINVIKNAYTVGSAVKGASMSVGYKYGAIDIGSSITDGCVKLYNVPAKCSYSRLGTLNDLKALALSSNYYQFIVALRVAGYKYYYDMKVEVGEEDFLKYRNVFQMFGLGSKTGIDLPLESTGLMGGKIAPDLLLNLAIGQYDLYTPVELLQYINTVASGGVRYKLNLMHSIMRDGETIKNNEVTELNRVDIDSKYIARIQEGFREVVKSGTGYWYANPSVLGAGKTGTSESYIDSDYNGDADAYVLSNTFIMYAPYDNPKYSIVVISPNTSDLKSKNKYRAPINRLLARNINDFLFSSQ